MMEKTEKVPFIEMLETSFDSQLSDAECEAFNVAYEEYIDMFYGLTAQSRKSFLDLLHEFARLRLRLMRLQERIVEKKSLQASLLKSALLLTNFEIRLVSVRLRYPSIAGPISGKVPKYPLYFSKEFTPNDVMELIAALHTAGVGRRIDGTRANVEQLVELFSWMFNVRINNPIQCRRGVINRKLRLTRFLDLLRNSLIDESQR